MNIEYDVIYNLDYMVILPLYDKDLKETFDFSFGNVLVFDQLNHTGDLINLINASNIKQLIFVDYLFEYDCVLSSLNDKHQIKFIYTKFIGEFYSEYNRRLIESILSLYNDNMLDGIGVLDINLYDVLIKRGVKCEYICLDISVGAYDGDTIHNQIGVINNPNNYVDSFYNSLSAIKLLDYKASIVTSNDYVKRFTELYNIDYSIDSEISKNDVNLCISFSESNNLLFLKSMDKGVPCILGNSRFLDDYDKLKEMLVINSDDDIDEISEKIKNVQKTKKNILSLYCEFRKTYSEKSLKCVNKFLEVKKSKFICSTNTYEKLLTIIVPVYNTSAYLKKCLNSIIKSLPKKMINDVEILIINDGSTDDSLEIIKQYANKYSHIIRYITQENHGLGNVRNVGLKNSKGKYISSIDSDDTIHKNFYEEVYTWMQKNVDMIVFDWLSIKDKDSFITSAIEGTFNEINKYEGLLYSSIMPSTCNKIIKRDLFDQLDILYNEDKYEDLSTNPFILLASKSIKYIKKPYYQYLIRENSIMRSSADYSMIKVLKVVNDRLKKYNALVNVDVDKFKYYLYSWRIEQFIINQLYDYYDVNSFIKEMDKIKNIIIDIFENKYYVKMLDDLSDKNFKEFIVKRNKAYKEGNLIEYLNDLPSDKISKLTPYIIYFGLDK